jgi:hypothetical protein
LSGSAISVSKAMTPSRPGLKSDIGVSSLLPHGGVRGHLTPCADPNPNSRKAPQMGGGDDSSATIQPP